MTCCCILGGKFFVTKYIFPRIWKLGIGALVKISECSCLKLFNSLFKKQSNPFIVTFKIICNKSRGTK